MGRPHTKIVVEEHVSAKTDPRKIRVPEGRVVSKPAVRGARRRSVLRDVARHAIMKVAGVGRAPEPETTSPVEVLPETTPLMTGMDSGVDEGTKVVEIEDGKVTEVETAPAHPIPGSTAPDGSPVPQEPKKTLSQAERQALIADAKAKKDAAKAAKSAGTKASGAKKK